jgi:hypothetical protein
MIPPSRKDAALETTKLTVLNKKVLAKMREEQ